MLSHVFVPITDFERAFEFYSAIMGELAFKLRFCDQSRPWAGWQGGVPRPIFLIGRPFDGGAMAPGNGHMVALLAPSRMAVDRCHETALRLGGQDEGAPGLRPVYHQNYYGAYFRDPDGNKLCACCHDAA